jgi:Zn-dependent protease with chaperone function
MSNNDEADDSAEHIALVRKYQQQASSDPLGFRRRVAWFAWLGCFALPAAALFICAIGACLIALGIIGRHMTSFWLGVSICLANIIPTYQIFKALALQLDAPDGVILTQQNHPEIFELVETVRAQLNAPKIDAVYLTTELNAAAVQRPVRGIFGPWRNEMVIGLPLLFTLSRAELAGIIGHELGHISGAHGRQHIRVMRTQILWLSSLANLEAEATYGAEAFAKASNWFLPRFMTMSAVQSQMDEFEADQAEVAISGRRKSGEAHVRLAIGTAYMDAFWSDLFNPVTDGQSPPAVGPIRQLSQDLPNSVSWSGAATALSDALAETTEIGDSHPCLRERLAAIGARPIMATVLAKPAASLLGRELNKLIDKFDQDWWATYGAKWSRLKKRHAKLAALDAVAWPRQMAA